MALRLVGPVGLFVGKGSRLEPSVLAGAGLFGHVAARPTPARELPGKLFALAGRVGNAY
jgi:hypothetical protein